MAKPESTPQTPEVPEGISINVVPVGPVVPEPQITMEQAFLTLCRAMQPLLDDNLPAQMHIDEIIGWYMDGNHAISWQHAVVLLGRVVGVDFPH